MITTSSDDHNLPKGQKKYYYRCPNRGFVVHHGLFFKFMGNIHQRSWPNIRLKLSLAQGLDNTLVNVYPAFSEDILNAEDQLFLD